MISGNVFLSILYFVASIPVFNKVYETSKVIIDEEFHLRQGKHFCQGNFDVWDPKITTFPGLYLISCVLLPFKLCSTYNLRSISLIASAANLYLIFKIREPRVRMKRHLVFDGLSLSLLPPLYFFAHLYYTDVLSVTTVLGMLYFWMNGKDKMSAFFGALSVLMRQTNILWVGLLFGISIIDEVVQNSSPFIKTANRGFRKDYDIWTFFATVRYNLLSPLFLIEQLKHLFVKFWAYIAVLLGFIVFLVVNGSIVVGDKSAHEAVVHLPQLLYFTVFSTIFSPALTLSNLSVVLKKIQRNLLVFKILAIVIFFVIYNNTLVHPYLLADNRHYTFYAWNWFFGKYFFAKYLLIPVYLLSSVLLYKQIEHTSSGFKIMFCLACFFALALQKLFELRYFIIPFLIARLSSRQTRIELSIFELILHLMVNIATFYIFFNKKIWWNNYAEPQRLIW